MNPKLSPITAVEKFLQIKDWPLSLILSIPAFTYLLIHVFFSKDVFFIHLASGGTNWNSHSSHLTYSNLLCNLGVCNFCAERTSLRQKANDSSMCHFIKNTLSNNIIDKEPHGKYIKYAFRVILNQMTNPQSHGEFIHLCIKRKWKKKKITWILLTQYK